VVSLSDVESKVFRESEGWYMPASSLGFSWYARRIVSSKSGCLLVAKLHANSPEESPSVGVGPALPSLSQSL
jgi:hypothetical protein